MHLGCSTVVVSLFAYQTHLQFFGSGSDFYGQLSNAAYLPDEGALYASNSSLAITFCSRSTFSHYHHPVLVMQLATLLQNTALHCSRNNISNAFELGTQILHIAGDETVVFVRRSLTTIAHEFNFAGISTQLIINCMMSRLLRIPLSLTL